jgi:hypothetical protein
MRLYTDANVKPCAGHQTSPAREDSMMALRTIIVALAAALLCSAALAAAPLPTVYGPTPTQTMLTPQQLDQLVAPIALYPDPLLTDILAASTYPAQIVEAQRFVASNGGLDAAALAEAASAHHWDPSVQALLPFPQVLAQLDGNLEWTDQLGHAFITQQADVLNAVQALRQDAERAGTLQNTPQQSVVNEGDDITINPPSAQEVYLPSYNAGCVYGPGVFDDGCRDGAYDIGWGDGIFLPYGYYQWGLLNWRTRDIRFNRGGYDNFLASGFGPGSYGGLNQGGVWRHSGDGVLHGLHTTVHVDSFHDAPSANMPLSRRYGRAIAPAHFAPGPALRGGGGFHVAPSFHAAPAASVHGGGGGHR